MSKNPRLQSFKTKLQKAGMNSLAKTFDDIEGRLAKVDWHVAFFTTFKPREKADNERMLREVETRFHGQLPPEIRTGLLDLYAICNGFSLVVGPAKLSSPLHEDADRDDWIDRPIGYKLLPFTKMAKWLAQFSVDADSAPAYEEGGLEQLFNSDFAAGAKADTAAMRYSSYLNLDDNNKLSWSNYCNESYAAHSLAITNDKFPGGYLSADGDQRPFLLLDKKRKPSRTPFSELLAIEIQEAIGHFLEAADVEEAPKGKKR